MAVVFLINSLVIALAVLIHYEVLRRTTTLLPRIASDQKYRVVIGVFIAFGAHVAEVWLFAASFYLMHHAENWGHLEGNFDGSFMDAVYFSFTTYTTLGTGDIEPFGDLRFLTGLESLTGLILITWTASFLFLEMSRYWKEK